MRTLMAVMVLLPTFALAQPAAEPTAPAAAIEPQPSPEPAQQVVSSPYWSTCRQIWTRSPYVGVQHGYFLPNGAPLPSGSTGSPGGGGSTSGGSGSSFGSGSGGGAGYAILALAVVVIAVLPFIIYAVDGDADALTLERFYCPEFNFTAHGGVQIPTGGGQQITGLGIAKVRADVGYVGAMADLGIMPSGNNIGAMFSAHFLVRPPPKAHIEGALALGGRRALGPGGALDGFELALPHTYVFSRDGYRKMGLELMPRVFFNRTGLDVGADLAFVAPIADVLQVRVGIGAFSHSKQVQLTASAGLVANL